MLLHTFTNILVKKLFGNDLVGRYPYVSLTNSCSRKYNRWVDLESMVSMCVCHVRLESK